MKGLERLQNFMDNLHVDPIITNEDQEKEENDQEEESRKTLHQYFYSH